MTDPARLTARPSGAPPPAKAAAGYRRLGVVGRRDARLYLPPAAARAGSVPLVVWLHGGGGGHPGDPGRMAPEADRHGFALLLPFSRERTWDVIVGGYGPDVDVIDRALRSTFGRLPVDPERVALGGFSDGASYALSLGITNGDLFTHLIAGSPGFTAPAERRGRPEVFVSHGTRDGVLPFEETSRRIVPELRDGGYSVRFVTFEGGHAVPPEVAARAARWFLS